MGEVSRGARMRAVGMAVAGLLVLTGAPATGIDNEPEGYGGAKFRMSEAQVREHFPELTVLVDSGGSEDQQLAMLPRMRELAAEGRHTVLGLESCEVKFKFAADQLYFVNFRCRDDRDMIAFLSEHFGKPTMEWVDAVYWQGEEVGVSLNRVNGAFGFYDRRLDRLVQETLNNALTMGLAVRAEREKQEREAEEPGGTAGTSDPAPVDQP